MCIIDGMVVPFGLFFILQLYNYGIKRSQGLWSKYLGKVVPRILKLNKLENDENGDVKIKTASGKGSKQSVKTLKTFYKFIYDTKPEWYIENKTVSMRTIEDAYRSYFADTIISSSVISRKLKGYLFLDAGRSNGETRKKLVTYETLKKNC
jgi:hypothetical protein